MTTPATAPRPGPRTFALHALAAALLWLVLAEGQGWALGTAVVLAAAAAARWTAPPTGPGPTLGGLVRFLPWAVGATVRGGFDVGRRALSRDPGLRPGWAHHHTALPAGRPRITLVAMLNLMPGTVGARFEGDVLLVHVLHPSVLPGLHALERRVARLYGAERAEPAP